VSIREQPPQSNRSGKRVLGLICSPRRLGNSECVVKEICRCLDLDHELRLIRLPAMDIRPCRACYTCLAESKTCPIDDDLPTVIDELCRADAIIAAAPTYFLGPNASLKNLLDRGLSFYARADELWGKPSVGVGIAGIPGKEGSTLQGIESFLKLILTEVKDTAMIYGALPGQALLASQTRSTARQLAAVLFGQPVSRQPCCPVCGGQTFRFLDHIRVRCMLCSNQGTASMENGRTSFDISRSEHELFLSRSDVRSHHAWLLQMKDRFRQRRRELLAVSRDYRDDGRWVVSGKNAQCSLDGHTDQEPLPGSDPGS
jgi:multimeric flavodoxin WrbA